MGKPSLLYEDTNPDWIPSKNLGHNEFKKLSNDIHKGLFNDGSDELIQKDRTKKPCCRKIVRIVLLRKRN